MGDSVHFVAKFLVPTLLPLWGLGSFQAFVIKNVSTLGTKFRITFSLLGLGMIQLPFLRLYVDQSTLIRVF